MADNSPREKLKRIRTAQGWREAYKASGLPNTGSDDTKRRRLSRAINKKTSGFKKLTPTQSKRVNRSFGQRKRSIANVNADLAIKRLNQLKAIQRKTLEGKLARGEITLRQFNRRILLHQDLNSEQEQAFRDAAQDPDDWDDFRQEYSSQVGTINTSLLNEKLSKQITVLQTKIGA